MGENAVFVPVVILRLLLHVGSRLGYKLMGRLSDLVQPPAGPGYLRAEPAELVLQ